MCREEKFMLYIILLFAFIVIYLMMLMRRQKEKMSEIKIQIDQLQAQHDRLQKERDQLQERMNHLEEQREHLQMQTDQAFRSADEIEKIYDEIWNHANTIHLYSSLAEEESKSITMKEKQKEIIQLAVKKKLNILVGGGTGSGKTTLANAVLKEIALTNDRLVIIEDTRELQCEAQDYEAFRTSMNVNATMLLRTTMRRRPDRIVVGEVRDGAAYDLLKAWNTGHPGGVSTTHANNALESLRRLESLSLEAEGAPPVNVINDLIGSTVKLVVFIARSVEMVDGKAVKSRKIKQVAYVDSYDFEKNTYKLIEDPDKVLDILKGLN